MNPEFQSLLFWIRLLNHFVQVYFLAFLRGFNPCCSGFASSTNGDTLLDEIANDVSILVVLDSPPQLEALAQNEQLVAVSILVVLDSPPQQAVRRCEGSGLHEVSILVVLDSPPQPS